MRFKSTLAVVLLVALTLAACAQSKSDKAMADVCTARNDITKQVDKLKSLTPTTATTTLVTDGMQAIRNDLSTIGKATKDLSKERAADVQSANDEFTSSVRKTLANVGTTVSIEAAAADLKAAFGKLGESYRSTFGQLDCSS
jgi:hypothetical protein